MRRLLLLSTVVFAAACGTDPVSPSTPSPAAISRPSYGIGTSPTRTLPPAPPTDPDPRGIGTSPSVTIP